MRGLSGAVRGAAIYAILVATASIAWADRLVMPYECRYDRDRPTLRPSAARSYEIIGSREQKPYTTCHRDGSKCSTLMVHRFQIDCDGARVSWMRVAAAIAPRRPLRHWIDGGRMNLVRPVAVDGGLRPCSERPRGDNRECLPWRPSAPLERIALPAGFAPLGVASARIEGQAGPAPAPAVAQPIQAVAVSPEAPSEAAAGAAPPPAPVIVADNSAPKPGLPAVTPTLAERVVVVEAKDLSEEAPAPETTRRMLWLWLGGLVALGGAAAAARSSLPGAVRRSIRYWQIQRRLAARNARRAAVSAQASAPAEEAAEPPQQQESGPDETALANAAWAAATLLDQIEQAVQGMASSTPLRIVLEDELAHINHRLVQTRASALEGESPARSAAQFRALVLELERVKRIADSAAASIPEQRPLTAVPSSKGEAYQLLGVNPEVSEVTLKKLVDALRMTWHPDHARSESDRIMREERIKQINVAWELIQDKRPQAA